MASWIQDSIKGGCGENDYEVWITGNGERERESQHKETQTADSQTEEQSYTHHDCFFDDILACVFSALLSWTWNMK